MLLPGGTPAAGGGGGGVPGFGRRGGGNGGRWFMNLQYTLDLKNEVLVAPGGPLLDLLNGDALSGGGQPRHSFSLRLGGFYKGFGTFINASYTGRSRINGTGVPGSTDLFFADLATVNMRVFVDLGQQESLVKSVPLLDKTRISLNLDNLFDARQQVVDSNGTTPLRYDPYLLDPIGRSFQIEIRKMF